MPDINGVSAEAVRAAADRADRSMIDQGVTPPTMLDANIGHYETIYKKCQESANRIVGQESMFATPGAHSRKVTNVTESLFKRFCDDQVEAAKTKQLTNQIESLLGMLGARR